MNNRQSIKMRLAELAEEVAAKNADYAAGRISDNNYYRKFISKANAEYEELKSDLKVFDQVARYSGGTETNLGVSQPGAADGGRIVAPSPMDMTPAQLQGLMSAAEHRSPFSIEIQPKSFRESIATKAAVTESGLGGGFSGNLPPVQSLYAVGLGYEPTRIADLLPGAAMPGPSATWLSHTSNSAEVAAVAEGCSKGDISPSVTESQVFPTKIAGQVSVSLEAWQDTGNYGEGQFSQWLPTELTRSLINEESNILLNGLSGTANATLTEFFKRRAL